MDYLEKGIDRRDFLRVTAAAGAGLMLSPMALGQAGRSKTDDLNIALLGSGAQGQVLLDACLKIPGIRFKAVCDIWTEYNQKRAARLLKKYGHELNTYEDYREMLDRESDLDAVIIATHEWYDSVMALYDYETREGIVKAFYQTIGTNSSQGYYECFMGEHGTLLISEAAGRGGVYREPLAPDWDKWVKMDYLRAPVEPEPATPTGAVLDTRETLAPPQYDLAVELKDPYHMPHLENFFDAVRGRTSLNCPPEDSYETAVTVLKVNQAVEAGSTLDFKPGEFRI